MYVFFKLTSYSFAKIMKLVHLENVYLGLLFEII